MSSDILNHQPALSTTTLPGTWLIDLPHDPVIHVKRYRPSEASRSLTDAKAKDDPLESAWRNINSSGVGEVRSILGGSCAVICTKDDLKDIPGSHSRELWVLHVKPGGAEDVTSEEPEFDGLEAVAPNLSPITPSQTLDCPRHGHDLSCLLRPSTSQRPLKSCDVRFDPQGNDRLVWAILAQAIVEKCLWKRSKRMCARKEKNLGIELYPTATGLLLRVKRKLPSRRAQTTTDDKRSPLSTLAPLGLPALLIGPYRSTEPEEASLASSFELSLGADWKDGQSAARIQAKLDHQPFHPFCVLWVPCDDIGDAPDAVDSVKKGQGVLTIWPSHLVTSSGSRQRRIPKSSIPLNGASMASHLDLMMGASGLFDAMSAYREPVPQITPPSDHSPEEPALDEEGSMTATVTPLPDDMTGQGPGDDDLEDLFASDTPARSPEPFGSAQPFEMFGDQNDRRLSETNNAHLIDYGDVVMSSPPAQEERRESLRQVISRDDAIEESDPAFVTEDDFNFFDSPTDDITGAHGDPPPDVRQEQPILQSTEEAENRVVPDLGLKTPPTEADVNVSPVSPSLDTARPPITPPPEAVEPATIPTEVSSNSIVNDTLAPVETPPQRAVESPKHRAAPARRLDRIQDFVPSAFEPLDLTEPATTFAYSLPTPAPTPQHLNLDLVERLSSPKATKQAYDYAAAWLLDAPVSEVDEEEYTGPPTPISYLDENDTSTAGPSPMVPSKSGSSQLEYEGMPCVTTEWLTMVDDEDRIRELARPWVSGWSSTSSTVMREPGAEPETATKKRKRQTETDRDPSAIDIDAFATQVIANTELRQSLTQRPDDAHIPLDSHASEMLSRGITLADFVVPDAESEEGEAVERKEQGPSKLSQCAIHVGFRGNVIRLSIAALRYWRELDLQPLSGKKDIKAVLLYENAADLGTMRGNFDRINSTYKSLGFGDCALDETFGKAGMQNVQAKKDGFASALAWLDRQEDNAALMIICHEGQQHDFTAYFDRKKLSTLRPTQIVHLVPSTSFAHRDIQDLARGLYDRFPRQLRTTHFAESVETPWYQYPAYALCPETPPKPHLTLQWPIKSFDVFGSWRWIHAAYGCSSDGRTIAVMVSDAEGENWQTKVLRDIQSKSWPEVISSIWALLRDFAASAAIEWRISVSRLGVASKLELDAWRQLYVTSTEPMSIMMSEPASSSELIVPRNGPPNVQAGIINDPTTTMVDESLAGSYFALPDRQPVVLEKSTIFTESSFLLSLATPTLEHDTTSVHLLFHRPAPGKEDEQAEDALAKEMYRIGCWSRVKFGTTTLPGHLGAVKAVLDAISAIEE